MTVAALVVSHNRKEYLRKCLKSLERQTHPLDEILVVDNGSTDGSVAMVKEDFPDVLLLRTRSNIGGAGGFSMGIDVLMSRNHKYAWLMDDNAEAHLDALRPLVAAMSSSTVRKPGFAASMVITKEGAELTSNTPEIIGATADWKLPPNVYPAAFATFVGVLINLDVARRTFLPVADFFLLW